jgi:hypothetical protein
MATDLVYESGSVVAVGRRDVGQALPSLMCIRRATTVQPQRREIMDKSMAEKLHLPSWEGDGNGELCDVRWADNVTN